jgi:hypothetical protein
MDDEKIPPTTTPQNKQINNNKLSFCSNLLKKMDN